MRKTTSHRAAGAGRRGDTAPTPADLLEGLTSLADDLEATRAHLQVVGRALTPEEIQHVDEIDAALPFLRGAESALRALRVGGHADPVPAPTPAPEPPPPPVPLVDGRYDGGNANFAIDLRVDEDQSGVISADVYQETSSGRGFVATLRTTPGTRISRQDRTWTIILENAPERAVTTGTLTLEAQGGDPLQVLVTIDLDGGLAGLPTGVPLAMVASWVDSAVRELGLEIEREAGVAGEPAFDHNGRTVTVTSCLTDVGFSVSDVGIASTIPSPANKWGTSQLHDLMSFHAEASLARRRWELHLLWLSQSSRSGLLGIMFDSGGALPRQGSAVFAKEIRDIPGIVTNRKLIQTTVHELGQALNLAHRFEREVGRADSTSFMNYDWRYRGGGRRSEFWSRFDFTFDPDEIEFLRHAPRPALIPGGDPFHSVRYWADGNGGYSPYLPEVPTTQFGLTLTAPPNGPVFQFAQPVFLEVTLRNNSGETLNISPSILDVKAGLLEVLIRRSDGGPTGDLGDAEPFVPIMSRCVDFDHSAADVVPDGGSVSNNINLHFGASGFAFAEPGSYEVTALLVLTPESQDRQFIARSNTLTIRVASPQGMSEEHDAVDLMQTDVGTWLALGGSERLPATADTLAEIVARRGARTPKRATSGLDPVCAAIVRAQGVHAGRWKLKLGDRVTELDGDSTEAVRLLSQLDDQALGSFDRHTAAGTQRLLAKHRARTGRGKRQGRRTARKG